MRARVLGAIGLVLIAIDVTRLFVLPDAYRVTFTDGFETFVVAACAIACVLAARRSRDFRRAQWALVAAFFIGMFAADLHDFIVDITGAAAAGGPRFLALIGWTTYLPLALLAVFPRKRDGDQSPWTWLLVLDLAQIALICSVAYFHFIYLAHLDTGGSWTTRVVADDLRNVLLSVGLLARAAIEPTAGSRRFYGWIGGLFGFITMLHLVFHRVSHDVVVIGRPAALMVIGIVAATWYERSEPRSDARPRHPLRHFVPPSWLIVLFPACGPLLVLLLLAGVPDQYIVWIELALVASTAMFAARVAVAEHLRDVGARALAASEARYRLLFERSSAGVFRMTLDGHLLECNDACARILGYATKEEAQRSHGIDQPPLALFADLVRQAHAPGQEVVFHRHDGETIGVLASVTVSDTFAEGTLVDITERQALQERLRQAQKMEAIGRLAGGIAHDFNNVLTVVTMGTQAVQRSLPRDDKRHGMLANVLEASSHASGLTKQLLAFSRAGAVARRVLDLGPVVENTATMLARVLGDHIELRVELDPGTYRVNADRGQIEQVIMNLALNARDAMPRGGVLTITLRASSTHAVLAVSDNGHGMTADVQRQMFDPFFTTKALGRGTGLGLATVYGIVEQHGGTIQVTSEVDEGTTIEVSLPCVEAPTVAPSSAEAALVPGRETVLVVDDERLVRDNVADLLGSLGYAVLTAADGADALAVEARHADTIDVLVTDVVMPVMGGVELAAAMRARRPGVRVLFMSGYAEGIAAGEHYLAKPFTAELLSETLREVISSRSHHS